MAGISEAITQIKKAESDADSLVEQSTVDAKAMIDEATVKANEMIELAKNEASEEAQSTVFNAEENAKKEAESITSQAEKDVENIKNDANLCNKPEKVLNGIINGKLSKALQDICLVDQIFFLDQDQKVGQFLKGHNAKAETFVRYEVGEGIEKRQDNFAEEVMSQING